ncbi:MAG: single-stranded DNA-binding protein, partial [Chitinophagaceae bacterium]
AWGKTDKHMVSILNKGNRAAINGKLVNRSYQDKEGRKHYATEVYANQFINLTPAVQKDNLPF